MGKDDIAHQGKCRTKTDGYTVDGGDDRNFHLEYIPDKMASTAGRRRNCSLVEGFLVASRAEATTGPGQHDRPDRLILVQINPHLLQLFVHIPIDGIQDL